MSLEIRKQYIQEQIKTLKKKIKELTKLESVTLLKKRQDQLRTQENDLQYIKELEEMTQKQLTIEMVLLIKESLR